MEHSDFFGRAYVERVDLGYLERAMMENLPLPLGGMAAPAAACR